MQGPSFPRARAAGGLAVLLLLAGGAGGAAAQSEYRDGGQFAIGTGTMRVRAGSEGCVEVTLSDGGRSAVVRVEADSLPRWVDSARVIVGQLPGAAGAGAAGRLSAPTLPDCLLDRGALTLYRVLGGVGAGTWLQVSDYGRFPVAVRLDSLVPAIFDVLRQGARVTREETSDKARRRMRELATQPFDAPTGEPVDTRATPRAGNAAPTFPPSMYRFGRDESALAQFVVTARGQVDMRTFRFLEPASAEFEAAVRRSVAAWRFEPARRNGQAVSVVVQAPFQFVASAR